MTVPMMFDDTSPWGRYRPDARTALALAVAHRLPRGLRAVIHALRAPIKHRRRLPLDLTVWGWRLRLMPAGNVSEQKLYSAPALFDPAERSALAEVLGVPGAVFVDVGANAGIYSFWAARVLGRGGHLIAAEPDPEMRRRLTFNAATNGIAIALWPGAVSDHQGHADLLVRADQRGTNTLDPDEAAASGGERQSLRVPVTTLLDLLVSNGATRCDAVKIDIEGHEPPVLRHFMQHAPDALLPRLILSEFKPGTRDEIVAITAARGYRVARCNAMNLTLVREGPAHP